MRDILLTTFTEQNRMDELIAGQKEGSNATYSANSVPDKPRPALKHAVVHDSIVTWPLGVVGLGRVRPAPLTLSLMWCQINIKRCPTRHKTEKREHAKKNRRVRIHVYF